MQIIASHTVAAAALATMLLGLTARPVLAACGADASRVDASCYNGDLQAAVGDALASGRPLYLPRATYRISRPLVIDYAGQADTGFLLISDGATIDGTGIPTTPVLTVKCSGGTRAAPKSCFYFHQQGTLLVNGNSNTWAVEFGNDDFSDAHNSIKIDHLIVNNAGPWGVALNYVLNADAFIVADAGDGPRDFHVGLALNQVQFSTIRGAATAKNGWALWLGGGYTMANTIQGIDLEESLRCVVSDSPTSARNTFIAPYLNCPYGVMSFNGDNNLLLNPLFGGATVVSTQIAGGFNLMQ
jgi:hypothetical protein